MRNCIKALLLTFLFANSCYATSFELLASINLDEATKKILKGSNVRVLGAKTEVIEGKKVHIIKFLTEDGRIQYEKIDAESGRLLTRPKN